MALLGSRCVRRCCSCPWCCCCGDAACGAPCAAGTRRDGAPAPEEMRVPTLLGHPLRRPAASFTTRCRRWELLGQKEMREAAGPAPGTAAAGRTAARSRECRDRRHGPRPTISLPRAEPLGLQAAELALGEQEGQGTPSACPSGGATGILSTRLWKQHLLLVGVGLSWDPRGGTWHRS